MPEIQSREKEVKEQKEKKEEEIKKEEPKEQIEIKKEEKIEKTELKKDEKDAEKDAKDRKLSILFKKKPLKILILLLQDRKWYPSLLARESGQSYVHATKIIRALEDIDLVTSEATSKKRIIKLTEKGEKLARSIEEVTKNL